MQSSSKEGKELSRKLDSANSVGSFWISRVDTPAHVFGLIESGYKARLFSQFSNAAEQLLSENKILIENIECPASPDDVIYTGDARFDEGQILDKLGDYRASLDEGNVKFWLLKIPKLPIQSGLSPELRYEITPTKIISGGEELIFSIDFSVNNGYIEFFKEPGFVTDGSRSLTIVTGYCVAKSYYRHPLGVDSINKSQHVVEYARNSQSPREFISAVASIAKQEVTTHEQILEEVHSTSEGVLYVFEKEVIKVSYSHILLTAGTVYPKGTVIGDGVVGYHGDGEEDMWWKTIDFRGGLSMGPITGDKLLLIPDRLVTAYVANMDSTYVAGIRKAHVRLELDGDKDAEDTYWDGVEKREKAFKKYLDDVVQVDRSGFSDSSMEDVFKDFLDDQEVINEKNKSQGRDREYRNIKRLNTAKATVNALDVFFESILSNKAFVIKLNADMIPNLAEVVGFINREHPCGCLPIVIMDYPDVGDTVSASELISDSFSYSVVSESQVSENLSMGSLSDENFTSS